MTLCEDLRSAGVTTYNSIKDVPYVRDDSWGSFKGSYGTVYRATTKRLVGKGQVFAIKEMQTVSAKDQLMAAQEIKFLRQFRHPNILELEDAFVIDLPGHQMLHTIRLVTKPWAHVSLHHFIQDLTNSSGSSTMCPWFKPQELDPWPSIVRQCLSGLVYLHSQQPNPIRHKDIKPHNILLYTEVQSSGKLEVRPIIIDFGISKEHIDGATTANTGTYEYKAPEQIKNQDPTLASDIFSLGCCFALIESILRPWPTLLDVYDAAMGTESCQFANNLDLVNGILQDRLGSAGPVSDGLGFFSNKFRELVLNMLEERPLSRPSASGALDAIRTIEDKLARFLDTPTLELCITLRGKTTILVEVDLSRLKTNGSLMQELESRYGDASRRGHWRFAVPFYRMSCLDYVEFVIQDFDCPAVRVAPLRGSKCHTSIHYSQSDTMLPSASRLAQSIWGFARDSRTKKRQILDHETDVYDGIPKKFGQSSMNQLRDLRTPVTGLGLEVREELDQRLIYRLIFTLIFIGSVVWRYTPLEFRSNTPFYPFWNPDLGGLRQTATGNGES
ncbi:hypothetical protein J4E89_008748 [Alternaria sp. Ai002NY15]|nr:hypothetical protein J4E89_008748 [Alternaria sp. Ai002NY15]